MIKMIEQLKPTTENLTKTFQEILYMESVKEVNYLDGVKGIRVRITVNGTVPRIIGKNGSGIRLIKHILKIQFGINNANISVIDGAKNG